MKKIVLAILALALAFAFASCGARLNKPGDPAQYYDTVLPGRGISEEGGEKSPAETDAETVVIPKISKFFDVVVKETESGILYLPYTDEDGNETGDIIIVGYNGTSFSVKIPPIIDGGNVRAISEGAFFGKPYIYTITIPDSVTEIGRAAFSACPSLRSIKFGRGVMVLPEAVLRNCKQLTKVELPDTLEVIGDRAFEGCISLEHLYIPPSVKEIGHDAFMTCERLTLDVSDNEYAAEYAKNNNVNIDLAASYKVFRRQVYIGLGIGAAVAAVSIGVYLYMRSRKEKEQPW